LDSFFAQKKLRQKEETKVSSLSFFFAFTVYGKRERERMEGGIWVITGGIFLCN
jgi:hypothetical protein